MTSQISLNFVSTEMMSSFDQTVHYFGKYVSNSGCLCCRPDEYMSFANQRLEQILFTELSQNKCFSKTRENWSTRIYEDKTPKLVDNSTVSPAMSKSSIIKSSASVSCSSIKVNRRKQANPCKSAPKFDPNFRGASFLLQIKIINGNSELKMTPLLKNYKLRKRMHHCRSHYYDTDSASGSDLDNSTKANSKQTPIESFKSQLKVCNSCDTRKTPLWRDAEDGTPLCNACGIRYGNDFNRANLSSVEKRYVKHPLKRRHYKLAEAPIYTEYKKYKLRCSRCWYIPKKDDKTYPKCVRCNAMLCLTGRKV